VLGSADGGGGRVNLVFRQRFRHIRGALAPSALPILFDGAGKGSSSLHGTE